jgi:hypothetical protein
MAEKSSETLRQEVIDHPQAAQSNGTEPGEAQGLAGRFDPFHDPYLADPYPFFAGARAATPVFYSPDLDYWVVTRYHDVRHILQTPRLFSAANTLAPLQPICPTAERLLAEGGFRPVPTLTNIDPPGHSRLQRLTNAAFTPRRVAALEPFVRRLAGRFPTERRSSGRPDLIRDLAWDLPALAIFRVLGIPDEDVPRVKAGAESRLLHPPAQCQGAPLPGAGGALLPGCAAGAPGGAGRARGAERASPACGWCRDRSRGSRPTPPSVGRCRCWSSGTPESSDGPQAPPGARRTTPSHSPGAGRAGVVAPMASAETGESGFDVS